MFAKPTFLLMLPLLFVGVSAIPLDFHSNITANVSTTPAVCDARSLITNHEGKRACVYIDTRGHPTVGIGYNLDNSGARAAIAAVGADYDKVRAGTQCLTDTQIMRLFEPSYQSAVSSARDCGFKMTFIILV